MQNKHGGLTNRELVFLILYVGLTLVTVLYLLIISAAPFKAFFMLGAACALPVFLERKE